MFRVTNNAPGGRGFNLLDGRTVYLDPGEMRDLDLAPIGRVEKAWIAARDVEIEEIAEAAPPNEGADLGAGGKSGDPAAGDDKEKSASKSKG